MDNFISKIIELDRSINDLEVEFKNNYEKEELNLKKRKDDLDKKYEKNLNLEREEYKNISLKEIENEKKKITENIKLNTNNIKEEYVSEKNILIDKIFNKHFSKESD